ncbi:MAG: hydantoinase B/oxoprolinase family protein [Deltaproteobacteria bacterium]|nr:hydantoinase B/oxoprolinase family protein [Deltaproteobacteria bacterium]
MTQHATATVGTDKKPTIDPITTSVILGALEQIAIEMGYKLMRMAYSSIIRESEDFGAALVNAQGQQLCESRQSTPLQSGPIPGYVRGILQQLAARGESIRPGDVIMHNDPYGGASHGPDVGFCVPVFFNDQLVGFSVTTAHHLDIGSQTPGSTGIVEAVDAYAEGLQFKAIKVFDQGKRNDAVWQILRDNVRVSDLVVGDMEAQIAACRIGAARYVELIERYGLATVEAACAELFDYSERLMRQAIERIPDGRYTATGYMDGYLDDPNPSRRNLPIVVTLTVNGSDMIVDLAGTAPQVADRPINLPFVGTVDVAVWLVLRSVLLDTETYGNIPQNSGLYRPITIVAPEGTLVNPIFPAPTIARFVGGNMLCDTVMRALSQALPEQVCAGVGNLKVIAASGFRNQRPWVHLEIFEGSYGGRYGRDGMDAVDTLYANTRNNPIEDIESHVPLRVERYELREDACAPGQWRGGLASIKSIRYLSGGGASVEGDGFGYPAWGYKGGGSGCPGQLIQQTADGEEISLPSKVAYRTVTAGDIFVAVGATGGGYGDPLSRDPQRVLDDVRDGYYSIATAEREYGVIISESLQLDEAVTTACREKRRAAVRE